MRLESINWDIVLWYLQRNSFIYNAAIACKLQGIRIKALSWLSMQCGQYATLKAVLTPLCSAIQAQGYLKHSVWQPTDAPQHDAGSCLTPQNPKRVECAAGTSKLPMD